jgi:hypothetical protein
MKNTRFQLLGICCHCQTAQPVQAINEGLLDDEIGDPDFDRTSNFVMEVHTFPGHYNQCDGVGTTPQKLVAIR